MVEARSRHALMPFRILADRTRGVSYLVMLIVGAAMFAMFYFLGLYIQQVLGYTPLTPGSRSCRSASASSWPPRSRPR